MRVVFTVLLPLLLALSSAAQTFDDFLTRVNAAPDSARAAIVDSFLNAAGAFPFIEGDTLAHFVYTGTGSSVGVPGDANQWTPTAFRMTRVTGTDFWHYTHAFEPDARLDYKFVINNTNWILDPRNPHTVAGGFGPNSELRMPGWVSPPEIELYTDIPHGVLQDTTFFSAALGNSRRVRIYTPPGYESGDDRYPLILFHDGLEYITLARADRVLDYLIAHGQITPVIAVFVPPVSRTAEYAGNLRGQFTTFITDELLPYVDSAFRTQTNPAARATLGASDGGNIALWLAVMHPEAFGNVAAQSSNVDPQVVDSLEDGVLRALRFYLDLGTYDIPLLLPRVASLVAALELRGYDYQYLQFHEGHSWGNWRAHIDNALIRFFPGDSVSATEVNSLPRSFLLLENYPNPFNATTTIRFDLPAMQPVKLEVFDIQGRRLATLIEGPLNAGTHELRFDASRCATGLYLCRLQTGREIRTQKLLLLK